MQRYIPLGQLLRLKHHIHDQPCLDIDQLWVQLKQSQVLEHLLVQVSVPMLKH
jgi:hypothetical protein